LDQALEMEISIEFQNEGGIVHTLDRNTTAVLPTEQARSSACATEINLDVIELDPGKFE